MIVDNKGGDFHLFTHEWVDLGYGSSLTSQLKRISKKGKNSNRSLSKYVLNAYNLPY